MRWVALIITGLVLALGSAQPSEVGAQRVPILTATRQAPTTPRLIPIPIRGGCPVAYDLPVAHINGDIWDAADYAKLLACMEAVKPRIIQVPPTCVLPGPTFSGSLNDLWSGLPAASICDATHDGAAYFYFQIPSDYASLTSFVVRAVSVTSGNVRWKTDGEIWQVGVTNVVANPTKATSTTTITGSRPVEFDLSSMLAGVTPGDSFGFRFYKYANNHDALDTVPNLRLFSATMIYTP